MSPNPSKTQQAQPFLLQQDSPKESRPVLPAITIPSNKLAPCQRLTKQATAKPISSKVGTKGKTKPNTLTTTKAPSYAVTYDDNDDLNVVYEEIEAFDFPALTYQFGFVDESGKRVDASTIDLTYDNWYGEVFADNAEDTNISANWKNGQS